MTPRHDFDERGGHIWMCDGCAWAADGFLIEAEVEAMHGPRYVEAIRGARAMREQAYWGGPSFVGVRPSARERTDGMPVGWFGR